MQHLPANSVRFFALVRYAVEGFHSWPNAPEHRAYLANRHRHMFHVEVSVGLHHNERDIEFHDLLDFCKEQFPGGDMGTMSCEAMAEDLGQKVTRRLNRLVTVSVFEDGEAGAVWAST